MLRFNWPVRAFQRIPLLRFQISFSHIFVCSLTSRINEKNGVIPVYKTEVSQEGNWKEVCVDIAILCNCDSVLFIMLADG